MFSSLAALLRAGGDGAVDGGAWTVREADFSLLEGLLELKHQVLSIVLDQLIIEQESKS